MKPTTDRVHIDLARGDRSCFSGFDLKEATKALERCCEASAAPQRFEAAELRIAIGRVLELWESQRNAIECGGAPLTELDAERADTLLLCGEDIKRALRRSAPPDPFFAEVERAQRIAALPPDTDRMQATIDWLRARR